MLQFAGVEGEVQVRVGPLQPVSGEVNEMVKQLFSGFFSVAKYGELTKYGNIGEMYGIMMVNDG